MSGWVLGVDSGGSGVRVAVAPAEDAADAGVRARASGGSGTGAAGGAPAAVPGEAGGTVTGALGEPVVVPSPAVTGAHGIDADSLLERVLPAAEKLLRGAGAERVDACCVGAAGMATLGGDLRERLPEALHRALGVRRLALAADGVTAYAGALGQRPGAVVAAGTGMIAVGTALDASGWRRADGWGHLLGDCGGGAWIGRAGLEAAMRAYDGRTGGSAALRARMEAVFGPPLEMPGRLYPRSDRPAVMASFAPEVARCAPDDPVAARILAEAAGHIVAAAEAVCPRGDESAVAFTGGLLRLGPVLLEPLEQALAERLPQVQRVAPAGDPLLGAIRIAGALATGTLRFPEDRGALLHLAGRGG